MDVHIQRHFPIFRMMLTLVCYLATSPTESFPRASSVAFNIGVRDCTDVAAVMRQCLSLVSSIESGCGEHMGGDSRHFCAYVFVSSIVKSHTGGMGYL